MGNETPETDAKSGSYNFQGTGGCVSAQLARDLERRLAACREFIQDAIDHDHFEAWHIDSARETLTLTAPKP